MSEHQIQALVKMGGNNHEIPLIEEPPEVAEQRAQHVRQLFVHAPVFHWHQHPVVGVDADARGLIEQVAHTLYEFGHYAEPSLRRQESELQGVMRGLETVQFDAQNVQDMLGLLRDDVDALTGREPALREEMQALRTMIDQKIAQVEHGRGADVAEVARVQEELQEVRLGGKRKCAELEAHLIDQAEVQQVQIKSALTRHTAQIDAEICTSMVEMKQWVQGLVAESLAPIHKGMQVLEEQVAQIADLRANLTTLEVIQEGLMQTIEKLAAEAQRTQESTPTRQDLLGEIGEGSNEEKENPIGPNPSSSVEIYPEVADSAASPLLGSEKGQKAIGGQRTGVETEEGDEHGESLFATAKMRTNAMGTEHYTRAMPATSFASMEYGDGGLGATIGSQRTLGVPSVAEPTMGQMKLEAPVRYSGARRPGVRVWLRQMERYMRLMRFPQQDWIDVVETRTEGGASAWINAVLQDIERGRRDHFQSWADFRNAMIKAFEPITEVEEARKALRTLKQVGRVSTYVQRFRELQYRLPEMTNEEAFSAFLAGLQPHIQEQVGAHIQGDLSAAMAMAERLDLYRAAARQDGSGGGASSHGPKGGQSKKKGQIHNVEDKQTNDPPEVNAIKEKKKFKKGSQKKKGPGDKASRGCFHCGGNHFLRNCKEWKELRAKLQRSSGNE